MPKAIYNTEINDLYSGNLYNCLCLHIVTISAVSLFLINFYIYGLYMNTNFTLLDVSDIRTSSFRNRGTYMFLISEFVYLLWHQFLILHFLSLWVASICFFGLIEYVSFYFLNFNFYVRCDRCMWQDFLICWNVQYFFHSLTTFSRANCFTMHWVLYIYIYVWNNVAAVFGFWF